jgi:phage terminase Nu1 subunit (DNA packaging protein)
LAELLGVSKQTISAWVREGAPVAKRGRRGHGDAAVFDLRAAPRWVAERYVSLLAGDFAIVENARQRAMALELLDEMEKGG